jgi:hypothetical protein
VDVGRAEGVNEKAAWGAGLDVERKAWICFSISELLAEIWTWWLGAEYTERGEVASLLVMTGFKGEAAAERLEQAEGVDERLESSSASEEDEADDWREPSGVGQTPRRVRRLAKAALSRGRPSSARRDALVLV